MVIWGFKVLDPGIKIELEVSLTHFYKSWETGCKQIVSKDLKVKSQESSVKSHVFFVQSQESRVKSQE